MMGYWVGVGGYPGNGVADLNGPLLDGLFGGGGSEGGCGGRLRDVRKEAESSRYGLYSWREV